MTDMLPPPLPAPHDDPQEPADVLKLGTLAIYGDRKALFAALAKAQASFAPIKRTRSVTVRSDKGNYSFDYAPLEEVIDATRPALASNGLAYVSMLADPEGEGETELHTMLTHESGAFMHVCERLPAVQKAQERGSQVTYRRRYQYQCVTGTSPEVDDDGNEADGNKVEAMTQKRKTPPAPEPKRDRGMQDLGSQVTYPRAQRPEPKPEPAPPPEKPASAPPPASPAEAAFRDAEPVPDEIVTALKANFLRLGMNGVQANAMTKDRYQTPFREMNAAQATDLLEFLKGQAAP